MNPLLVALLGNRVVFWLANGYGLWLLYNWLLVGQDTPWWVPVLAMLLISAAWRARSRYKAGADWQQRWNALRGISAAKPPSYRKRLAFASVVLWFGCLWWLGEYGAQGDGSDIAAALALGIAAVWVGVAAGWVLRGAKRWVQLRKAKRESEFVVSTPLPIPSSNAGLDSVQAALPDYCQQLISRSQQGALPG